MLSLRRCTAAALCILLCSQMCSAFLFGFLGRGSSAPATETPSLQAAAPLSASDHTRFDTTASALKSEQNQALALVREVMTHSSGHPSCRKINDQSEMQRRCAHLTEVNKVAILVAITECHIAKSTHMSVKSCQDLDDMHIEECMREMNRDKTIFRTYTSFFTRLNWICEEVDRDHTRRRSHDAIDAIFSATASTAEAMGKLQRETYQLTADMQGKLERSGEAVMDLLTQHTSVETVRFEALNSATARLEHGQSDLLTTLTTQGSHLRDLLRDSQGVQQLINATSAHIAATQVEIISLQGQASDALGATRDDLLALKQDQAAQFARALGELKQLQTLSDALAEAQRLHSQAVDALALQQETAFKAAGAQLGQLGDAQAASFRAAQSSLAELKALQADISVSQSDLLVSVKTSSDDLRALATAQRESFAETGESLNRIHAQAIELETRLGGMLFELKAAMQHLLELNFDVLRELFQVHSALFYVAIAPLAYFVTATERTHSARFWIFALLIGTLLLEFNLTATAQRFRYHLTQAEFDTLRSRLRYALAVLSLGAVTLSAVLYDDLPTLAYDLQQRSSRVLDNNHRMLHELIARTEHLSPRAEKGNVFQNDAKKVNPQDEGQTAATATITDWKHASVHDCCDDQRAPQPGMIARMIRSASGVALAAMAGKLKQEPFIDASLMTSPTSQDMPRLEGANSPAPASVASFSSFDGPDDTDDDPPPRVARATRSKSRGRASEPSPAKKVAIKEEDNEEYEPGLPQSASKKKKAPRHSV